MLLFWCNFILLRMLLCVSNAGTITQCYILQTAYPYSKITGISSFAIVLSAVPLMTISGSFIELNIYTYKDHIYDHDRHPAKRRALEWPQMGTRFVLGF